MLRLLGFLTPESQEYLARISEQCVTPLTFDNLVLFSDDYSAPSTPVSNAGSEVIKGQVGVTSVKVAGISKVYNSVLGMTEACLKFTTAHDAAPSTTLEVRPDSACYMVICSDPNANSSAVRFLVHLSDSLVQDSIPLSVDLFLSEDYDALTEEGAFNPVVFGDLDDSNFM